MPPPTDPAHAHVQVTPHPSGCFDIMYAVNDESLTDVEVRVSVCGVVLWSGAVRQSRICGTEWGTLPVTHEPKYGIVVTEDGKFMAVICSQNHIHVFSLGSRGGLTPRPGHVVGGVGSGPLLFQQPERMCLTANGNLLVCDQGSYAVNAGVGCVQELTGPGDAPPSFVRILPVARARSVAAHGALVAVGTADSRIELIDYASGATIRSIVDQYTALHDSLQFTACGQFVLSAGYNRGHLTMFSVTDGSLFKIFDTKLSLVGGKDVLICPNGEIMAVDCSQRRVSVFEPSGGALVRSWSTASLPGAFALAANKLFVLHFDRVQVFV